MFLILEYSYEDHVLPLGDFDDNALASACASVFF
jgi:hypothetical protein